MADSSEPNDLFMKFVEDGSPTSGKAIPAESTTVLVGAGSTANRLLKGFEPLGFFEVRNFTLSAGLLDGDDTSAGNQNANNGHGHDGRQDHGRQQLGRGNHNDRDRARDQQRPSVRPQLQAFTRWQQGEKVNLIPDMKPVTFTRSIDVASARLMQNCIDGKSYSNATLIKRKAAGSKAAGEVYLRVDFVGVLMTEMSWSNDDEVEEQCEFICRSLTISYRPQLPDGTLGAVVPGFWGMRDQQGSQVIL